jgi:hypothetical protein
MKKIILLLLIFSVNAYAADVLEIKKTDISPAVMVRCLVAADQYSNVDPKESKMFKNYSTGWGLMLTNRLGGDANAADYIRKYGSGLFADILSEPVKYLLPELLNCMGLVARLDRAEVREFFPQ